jgi:hypothetical protein
MSASFHYKRNIRKMIIRTVCAWISLLRLMTPIFVCTFFGSQGSRHPCCMPSGERIRDGFVSGTLSLLVRSFAPWASSQVTPGPPARYAVLAFASAAPTFALCPTLAPLFVDDRTLVASSLSSLQQALGIWEDFCRLARTAITMLKRKFGPGRVSEAAGGLLLMMRASAFASVSFLRVASLCGALTLSKASVASLVLSPRKDPKTKTNSTLHLQKA